MHWNASPRKELFNDPVLQGVEGDDGHHALRLEERRGLGEESLKVVDLGVHLHPDGLERPSSGVDAFRPEPSGYRGTDARGQGSGGFNWAAVHYDAGDTGGKPLFTVGLQDVHKHFFRVDIDYFISRKGRLGTEAHIKAAFL